MRKSTKQIFAHKFFAPLNWQYLYEKRNQGPMIPKCGTAFDMSNFDEYEDKRVKGVKGNLTQAEQDKFKAF